ncbi:hypothetical protein OOK31_25395 [Streptomyces sp. NBC_00249]|uniref:hypothetical protein n=1 Tax=Streptomyces sp. NBC_00249 TaxID=2975690 RepID=UPI00225154D6|nr:hypothetical protein [Streptomyces sp. NBC_00249]MCX5197192.1 hypothetical protein [Streptomyces sp. NBC_00249]
MSTPIRIDADVKLDSKILTDVAEAFEPHADQMFKQPKGHWVAVVEFTHVERTEPGPDEDKDPSVKVRITDLEIAADTATEHHIRQLMADMHRQRTSDGTLDAHVA